MTTTSPAARNHIFVAPPERPPRLRASDADRSATVTVLQDAVARGLLGFDEGDERIAAAFATRHVDELPPLTADLPAPPPAPATAPGWRRLGTLAGQQVRHEIRATRAAGLRSRRFLVAVLLAALLLAVVLLGAFAGHAGPDRSGTGFGTGFGTDGPGFHHHEPPFGVGGA
jgi:hypothetical protein